MSYYTSSPSIIVPFFLNRLVSSLTIIFALSLASSPHAQRSSGNPQVLQIVAIRHYWHHIVAIKLVVCKFCKVVED